MTLSSRNGKVQKRGKFNFIGRLQLSTETSRQEENEGIVALRVLRVQVRCNNNKVYVVLYTVSKQADNEVATSLTEVLFL